MPIAPFHPRVPLQRSAPRPAAAVAPQRTPAPPGSAQVNSVAAPLRSRRPRSPQRDDSRTEPPSRCWTDRAGRSQRRWSRRTLAANRLAWPAPTVPHSRAPAARPAPILLLLPQPKRPVLPSPLGSAPQPPPLRPPRAPRPVRPRATTVTRPAPIPSGAQRDHGPEKLFEPPYRSAVYGNRLAKSKWLL